MTLADLYALAASVAAHPNTVRIHLTENFDPRDGTTYWGAYLSAQPRDKRTLFCQDLPLSRACASREGALLEAAEALPGFVSLYQLGPKEP